MYNVSPLYKTQIKNTVRNPSYIRIKFSVTDPDADNDASFSDNGHTLYSDTTRFLTDDVSESYSTLEHNFIILNGTSNILPDNPPYIFEGYVSEAISDENGEFTTPPVFEVSFTQLFRFVGLSFSFDTINGTHPFEIVVKGYDGVTEVFSKTYSPDKDRDYSISDPINNCDKITVTCTKTFFPYSRFRINDFIMGLVKTFTENEIKTATWSTDVDPVSSKLPNLKFKFTILDINKEYDPENPSGIYPYIESKQAVKFDFGYELDNGSIEWITGGNYFSNGTVVVNTQATIPTAEFTNVSTIGHLTDTYNKGVYSPSGTSLYDLAENILNDSNIPSINGVDRWKLDASLQSIFTKVPLPIDTTGNLLQLIANAGMCTLNVDRDGFITIKQADTTPVDFVFTLVDVYSPPKITKYPSLKGVDTINYSLVVDSVTSQIATFDIVGASNTTYNLSYSISSGVTASVDAGLTIVGTPEYYAENCIITLTGTGTLTLTGYAITVNKNAVSVEFEQVGERCSVDNPLINNHSHAVNYATWIGNDLSRRNLYEIENRGFPELDAGDYTTLNTLYTDNVNVSILSNEVTYDGALSAKTKLLISGGS